MAKKSPVLWVDRPSRNNPYFRVLFTRYQYNKLPDWVANSVRFHECYQNPRRMYLWVEARDELEALLQFEKLWAALPKKEE